MKIKVVYVSLVLIICLAYNVNSDDTVGKENELNNKIKEAEEELKKAGEKVTDFATLIISDDPMIIVQSIVKFAEIIPYLGPIASMVSGMFEIFDTKLEEQLAPILKQLAMMDSKLNQVISRLDHLRDHVENVVILKSYKDHVEKIHDIDSSYQRYLNNPNNATKEDLIEECKGNPLYQFVGWVHREITTEKIQSLRCYLVKDYDEGKLKRWTSLLIGKVGQAIVLHSICLGVKHEYKTGFNGTLQKDNAHFKKKLQSLQSNLTKHFKNIRDNFFENKAIKEIDELVKGHAYLKNSEFLEKVYDFLSKKYYFRSWLVHAINKAKKIKDGYIGWSSKQGKRHKLWTIDEHDKYLFVGSSDTNKRNFKIELNTNHNVPVITVDGELRKVCYYYPSKDNHFNPQNYAIQLKDCLKEYGINAEAVGVTIQYFQFYKNYFIMKGYSQYVTSYSMDGLFMIQPLVRQTRDDAWSKWYPVDYEIFIIDKDL